MPIVSFIRKNWLKATILIIVSVIALFIIIAIARTGGTNNKFVPPEFYQARQSGVVLAEEIVQLSKDSIKNLEDISAEDEIGNYTSGLELVLDEVERNAKARERALTLSGELGTMASSLSQVKPDEAAKIGLQAIINESQIAQRLINYNNYTLQLLRVLQSRFETGESKSTDEKAQELVSKMNEEASAINELNQNYQDLMTQFDNLTEK